MSLEKFLAFDEKDKKPPMDPMGKLVVMTGMAIIFILFGFDLYKRKKANLLHVLIFLWGWAIIILFAYNQELLNKFGRLFGTARGVDIFVYAGIILLFYFFL